MLDLGTSWGMDQLKKVVWSNESRFVIHCADGLVKIHHFLGEQLLSLFIGHTQAGGSSIIVWWTFSYMSLESMVVVKQNLNAVKYLSIIADQLHLFMASVFPTGNWMFQHYKALCQKTRIVLEWFQERDAAFHLMFWQPISLDLNLIKHI